MKVQPDSFDFTLEPADNERLANLCGQFDEHLRQVEGLTEELFAARATGPVLAVTSAGLITKKLAVQEQVGGITVSGTYGIFQPGKVYARFVGENGSTVATADSFSVKPDDSLKVTGTYQVPAGTKSLQLQAVDANGSPAGLLDSASVPVTGVDTGRMQHPSSRTGYSITPHGITVHGPEGAAVALHTLSGRLIAAGRVEPGKSMTLPFSQAYRGTVIISISGQSGRKLITIPVVAGTVR